MEEDRTKKYKKNFFQRFAEDPLKSTFILMSLVIIMLTCCLFTSATWLTGVWLRTYRAFTQETVVAEIEVSEVKEDDDGDPYVEVKYKPVQTPTGLQAWLGIGGDTQESTVKVEVPGDAFRIQADFFTWEDWATFIGLKPVYKVNRIAGDYTDISDYNRLDHHAEEINNGTDDTWQYFKDNSGSFEWIGTAYTSSAGQNATDDDREFELIVTEDGLILKEI